MLVRKLSESSERLLKNLFNFGVTLGSIASDGENFLLKLKRKEKAIRPKTMFTLHLRCRLKLHFFHLCMD